jgi:hypothetical protein
MYVIFVLEHQNNFKHHLRLLITWLKKTRPTIYVSSLKLLQETGRERETHVEPRRLNNFEIS